MSVSDSVMIIGAGPYGLSIAAHLKARGVPFRIFGKPMHNWRAKMPQGMHLKSDGFASNLSHPGDTFTLEHFSRQQGFEYAHEGIPVPIENFIAYGDAFQRRFVPELEERLVVALDRNSDGSGFAARLDNGEIATARKVVLAIGISDFPYMPPHLAGAPAEFVSHPADHADMAAFRGRSLAIVGAGSSAIDLAALAQEAGSDVTLVMRRPELRFHSRATLDRPLAERIRAPNTGIGPGWRSVFYTETPRLFRRFVPSDRRHRIVNSSHGPAGGWYMRERIVGKVPVMAGSEPQGVEIRNGRVDLKLGDPEGLRTLTSDHVIVATGYRVDLRKIGFLAETLRRDIAAIDNKPELSPHFETTVPGLYVVGPAASHSFGPMFRFVFGAPYTAPRVAKHLAASVARSSRVERPPMVAAPAPADARG